MSKPRTMEPAAITACRAVLRHLVHSDSSAAVFCAPVDVSTYVDYLKVIKVPMDFQTIDEKLCATASKAGVKLNGKFANSTGPNVYTSLSEFIADVKLVFDNCKTYNNEGPLMEIATKLASAFEVLCNKWLVGKDLSDKNIHVLLDDAPTAPWDEEADEVSESGADDSDNSLPSDASDSDDGNDGENVSVASSSYTESGTSQRVFGAPRGSAKPRSASRERKRPARDLRGAEVVFTCPAGAPAFVDNDAKELRPHFEKLQAMYEWLDRVCPTGRQPITTWKIEIIRRTSGAMAGTMDSYFMTREWKRFRTRKDLAAFLNLPAEEECTREEAAETMVKEHSHVFELLEPGDQLPEEPWLPLVRDPVGPAVRLLRPLRVSEYVTVYRLGRIVDSSKFCNRRYVFPLGFMSKCVFFHRTRPGRTSTYRNEILVDDDGVSPKFRVTNETDGTVKEASNPVFVWTLMLEDILIGIHKYWHCMQVAVHESEAVCAANTMPSNSTRALAKTNDAAKIRKIIRGEVSKLLSRMIRDIEVAERKGVAASEIAESASVALPVEAPRPSRPPVSRKRRPLTLKDLIKLGVIDPGGPGLTLEYKENMWHAQITEDGSILYDGNFYDSPSAFSINMKRTINPSKMADDGWKSLRYDGESLDKLKVSLTDEDWERVERFRDDDEAKRRSSSSRSNRKRMDDEDDNNDFDDMVDNENGDGDENQAASRSGIGDKDYLKGAPNLDLLPQPYKIRWWEVDLTPLLNEQLAMLLFGLDRPECLNAIEALPTLGDVESYMFRMQKDSKAKLDTRLDSRHEQLCVRIERARHRIGKHQDSIDRRSEAAARRHLRIEDRHSRNWRAHLKKMDKEHSAQVRREDRAAKRKDRLEAIQALSLLQKDLEDEMSSCMKQENSGIVKALAESREARAELESRRKELEGLLKDRDSDTPEELSRVSASLRESLTKVARLDRNVKTLGSRIQAIDGKQGLVKNLFSFCSEIVRAGSALKKFLDSQIALDLPVDEDLIPFASPLALNVLRPIAPIPIAGDLLQIWDFFSKFAPDFGLCDKPDMLEGMFGVDDTANDGDDDDEGDVNDDNDDDDDEEEEEEEEEDDDDEGADEDASNALSGTPSASKETNLNGTPGDAVATDKPKKKKKKKKTEKTHYLEGSQRTPVVFLSEIRRALQDCNMHFLGPVHLKLVETLFLGASSTDEESMSEAARERSVAGRRYAPLNYGTWQECLRFFLMFYTRQLETPHENMSVKEFLHNPDASWSCAILRREEVDEEEEEPELGSNARRQHRRMLKQKNDAFRDEAMVPIFERTQKLARVDYSGSDSAEALLGYPETAAAVGSTFMESGELEDTSGSNARDGISAGGALVPVLLTQVPKKQISSFPTWAQKLFEARDVPIDRGNRINSIVREVVALTSRDPSLVELTSKLRKLIRRGTVKSSFNGYAKRVAMNLLSGYVSTYHVTEQPGKRKRRGGASGGNVPAKKQRVKPTRLGIQGEVLDWDTANRCRAVVRRAAGEEYAEIFSEPVSLEDFPNYLEVVDIPMDLQSIDKAIVGGRYAAIEDVKSDLDLIWANCQVFNDKASEICKVARRFEKSTNHYFKAWVQREPRAAKRTPFVWQESLPPAPWGSDSTEIFCKERPPPKGTTLFTNEPKDDIQRLPETTATRASEENSVAGDSVHVEKLPKKKRKKKKVSLSDFELTPGMSEQGYKMDGRFVGSRVSLKREDGSSRGTVVAILDEELPRWHVLFDDDRTPEDLGEASILEGLAAYESHASRKKMRKDRKTKKKKEEDVESEDEEDDDGGTKTRGRPDQQPVEEPNNVKQEAEANEGDTLMRDVGDESFLRLSDKSDSMLGSVVVKWFPEGCAEGFVQHYADGKFTLKFANDETIEVGSLEEVVQVEKESIFHRVGSERNGVEDAREELRKLGSRPAPEFAKTRHGVNLEGNITEDPCNPKPHNRSHEIGTLKRLCTILATENYEDICFEDRVTILRIICEQVVECGVLREAIERKMHIVIKTRQQWRQSPPIVDRDPKVVRLEKEIPEIDADGVLDRVAGEGLSEQAYLSTILSQFRIKNDRLISKTFSRSIEKLQREIERQMNIKKKKDEKLLVRQELEWKLQLVATRPKVLGRDRFFNRYLYFPGDPHNVYVNTSDKAVEEGVVEQSGWFVICTRPHLNQFLDSLNLSAFREHELFHAIQARSNLIRRCRGWQEKWFEEEFGGLATNGAKAVKTEPGQQNIKQEGGNSRPVSTKDEVPAESASGSEAPGSLKTLLGRTLEEDDPDGFEPEHFFKITFAYQIVGEEVQRRHYTACVDACEHREFNSLEERYLIDLKVILLDMEYAILTMKLDDVTWLHGLRSGWIRLITSATCWQDLRQACAFLEYSFDGVPLENWYVNLYGDAGYALRVKSSSSLAMRIMALDSAINYSELERLQSMRSKSSSKSKKRRR